MSKKELEELIEKYLAGKCNKEEKRLIRKFYDHFDDGTDWEAGLGDPGKMKKHMFDHINEGITKKEAREKEAQILPLWKKWAFAAAVCILLLLGGGWWWSRHNAAPQMAFVEKTTSGGQKSTILLSDGTRIRLNSAGKLIYPEKFSGDTREIRLIGEAFFDVAHDEKRPFIIRSGDITTTVLGTSFNISAFPEQDIEVTVASGKVAVSSDPGGINPQPATGSPKPATSNGATRNPQLLLSPGQQAFFDISEGTIEKKEVDIKKYLAWKEGEIYFESIRFEEAMAALERWYGVSIKFETEAPKDCVIEIAAFTDERLTSVLKTLTYILEFDFRIVSDKEIVITGRGCPEDA